MISLRLAIVAVFLGLAIFADVKPVFRIIDIALAASWIGGAITTIIKEAKK